LLIDNKFNEIGDGRASGLARARKNPGWLAMFTRPIFHLSA
jgi:hypothetical protein